MNTFVAESRIRRTDGEVGVTLETADAASPFGPLAHPQFFSGFLARPDVVAAGLLAVAEVAGTRYFDLGALRASRDPIVTASGDRLRFESFSGENGVYARLDVLADGIDSGDVGFGTTNIDLNDPIRRGLAALGRSELVHLAVGDDEVRMSTPGGTHIEREVELPERWRRGLAQSPLIAERMMKRATMGGPAAGLFLRSLPPGAPGPSLHLVPAPSGLRKALFASADSIPLTGASRIGSARRIARFATGLTIMASEDGASGWVFELPGARFTLMLSPEPWRGFSGEGALLSDLTGADGSSARVVAEQLAWEPAIDIEQIARDTGLSVAATRAGIARLASAGRVGFDIAEQAWFHRELPGGEDTVDADNPRLVGARELVSARAVSVTSSGWTVESNGNDYYVDRVAGTWRCSCLWWARHYGSRGPCKHVLAVQLTEAH